MKATMLSEADGYFEMSDGRSPFKVPKKGLSEALQNKIRSMAEPQKLAEGGGVMALPSRRDAGPVLLDEMGNPFPAYAPSMSQGAAQPVTGESLGLKSIPAGATFSLPPPAPIEVGGLPQGMKAERPAETTLVDTGRMSGGMPVVEEATGYIDKPLPTGLRLKAPAQEGIAPVPAPVAAKPQRPTGSAPMVGLADIRGGAEVQKGAAIMGANAAAEQGRQTAEALGAYETQLQSQALEDKRRQEESAQRTAALMSDYKAAQDEMRNINTTVDPGRFWASKSTGGKIAGIIGLALGAFGAGADGINRAAQMLNQAIDRDLEAQKAEHTLRMQKGKLAVDSAQTAYGMERQRFGDDLAASNAAKASLLGLAENNLKKIAAGAKGPAEQAQAMALLGQLQVQKGQLEAGLANTAFDNQTQRMLANGQLARGAAGTPAEAKAIREARSNYDLMSKTVGDLEGLIADTNFVTEKVGGKAAKMQGLAAGLLLQVKDAEKLGTLDRGSLEFAEKIIGDPGATFTLDSTKISKLNTLLGQSKRRLDSMVSQ